MDFNEKSDTCDECDFYYSENEIRMFKHDSIYKTAQFTDSGFQDIWEFPEVRF